ncbi:hypothetical protein TWF506_010699 [Arthrobotrys conoides]|uniref:F-box domain-containing protein n=1 Tax=Arthrobotrys conoides TaxID=74498 RepID=A0AAN8PC58_9PEZI
MDLLSALPTELWYYVVSFLGPSDKILFAQCSWTCFFIALPNGVKIPDVDYEWSLRPFSYGGRLAEFKHRIHSARFDIAYLSKLHSQFRKAAIFPNLHRLEVNFTNTNAYQKGIVEEMFSLLSTLPYFENLTHMTITWHMAYDTTAQFDAERRFIEKMSKRADRNADGSELIIFPKSLRSLTLFIARLDFILPLLNFEGVTDVAFLNPIQPPNCIFWNIKKLTMDTLYPVQALNLPLLPTKFPSVETFSFLRPRPGALGEDWIQHVPNFPKMKVLSAAWPQVEWKNVEIEKLETALQTKLCTSDDFPALEKIIFHGYRDFADHRRNITATCVISRTGSQKPGEGFGFSWYGNILNYQDDPGFLESLLDDSSGEEWEEGNTDGDNSEFDEKDGDGIEEEGEEYDSDYLEHLSEGDEPFIEE